MFVQVSSKVLEYFFVGDNVRPLFQFATVGAQGGSEGALLMSTALAPLIEWHHSSPLRGGFFAHFI